MAQGLSRNVGGPHCEGTFPGCPVSQAQAVPCSTGRRRLVGSVPSRWLHKCIAGPRLVDLVDSCPALWTLPDLGLTLPGLSILQPGYGFNNYIVLHFVHSTSSIKSVHRLTPPTLPTHSAIQAPGLLAEMDLQREREKKKDHAYTCYFCSYPSATARPS